MQNNNFHSVPNVMLDYSVDDARGNVIDGAVIFENDVQADGPALAEMARLIENVFFFPHRFGLDDLSTFGQFGLADRRTGTVMHFIGEESLGLVAAPATSTSSLSEFLASIFKPDNQSFIEEAALIDAEFKANFMHNAAGAGTRPVQITRSF